MRIIRIFLLILAKLGQIVMEDSIEE